MSLEITGKLVSRSETQVISEKFSKRDFVIEITEESGGNSYPQYVKLQLTKNKVDLISKFKQNDMIKVSFNLKGKKYEKNGKTDYFTNLEAWRIESVGQAQAPQQQYQAPPQQQYQQQPQNTMRPRRWVYPAKH